MRVVESLPDQQRQHVHGIAVPQLMAMHVAGKAGCPLDV
jgi:hypothetical protein